MGSWTSPALFLRRVWSIKDGDSSLKSVKTWDLTWFKHTEPSKNRDLHCKWPWSDGDHGDVQWPFAVPLLSLSEFSSICIGMFFSFNAAWQVSTVWHFVCDPSPPNCWINPSNWNYLETFNPFTHQLTNHNQLVFNLFCGEWVSEISWEPLCDNVINDLNWWTKWVILQDI